MSDNESGSFVINDTTENYGIYTSSGNISHSRGNNANTAHWADIQVQRHIFNLNVKHTHSGTTGSVREKYGSANTGWMSKNSFHSHTVNGGGNGTASGNAHENMPPYIVKYCWERVS